MSDTIHAEENRHCIVCHHEQATVIFHPPRDIKKKQYGLIESICKNEKCKAEVKIPILENPKNDWKQKTMGRWW